MAFRVTITERAGQGAEYVRSFVQDRAVIGRAKTADICLPDMAVSTRHAEIRVQSGLHLVVDLGSVNGTEVNGVRLVAHRPRRLADGDTIVAAPFCLRFQLGAVGSVELRNTAIEQARVMLAQILARSGNASRSYVLAVVDGPSKPARYELPREPATFAVGRATECAIRLDDPDVSRKHAEIVVTADGVVVRDAGSRNGIEVAGNSVAQAKLEPGDRLVIGKTTLCLERPEDRSLAAIFDAPEEETSSFSVKQGQASPAPRSDAGTPDREDQGVFVAEPTGPFSKIETTPIGPTDPLSAVGQERGLPVRQKPRGVGGTDVGLIIIGAIIVAAAVIGLVYLFS